MQIRDRGGVGRYLTRLDVSDAHDENALPVLRQAEVHRIEETPLDEVAEVSERLEDSCEVSPVLHREGTVNIFKDKESRSPLPDHLGDLFKQRAPRIPYARLLSG